MIPHNRPTTLPRSPQLLALTLLAATHLAVGQQLLESGSADGPALFIEQVGVGDRIIIVLHGGPGRSHDYLRPEWDRLSRVGYRVVYYDQRGCGRSADQAPYTWRSDVADLRRVIARVSDGDQVVLAGSSWGSLLALLYSTQHPEDVSSLILSGTPPWWREPSNSYGSALIRRILESQGQYVNADDESRGSDSRADSINQGIAMVRRVQLDRASARADFAEQDSLLALRIARPPQQTCTDAAVARMRLWGDVPPLDSLPTIPARSLLIWGGNDRMLSKRARSIANRLTKANVEIIPSVGHDPWFEAPQKFFEIVLHFLRDEDAP